MQLFPQTIMLPVQWHTPEMHCPLTGHALPQPPQFWRSEEISTQVAVPGQTIRGDGQVALHVPPVQYGVAVGQGWPQPPQLFGSVLGLMQAVPHAMLPVGQLALVTQSPATQLWPIAQARSQCPQWVASVLVSTQALPHEVCPARQATAHVPLAQNGAAGAHALTQVPQCAGSVSTFTVACPHWANPGASVLLPQAATNANIMTAFILCIVRPPSLS
jgi:hypothetical protein